MREGFGHQLALGCTPIDKVEIPPKHKGHMASLMAAIQYIYVNSEWNNRVEALLSEQIRKGKKQTGRKGMGLWELFVLGQVRLCMNISYDELLHLANYDAMLRGVMGVLPTDYSVGIQYEYQNIYDNVSLLTDELLREVNQVIVGVGHEVFKKKEGAALSCKTDSYVVETDTHFPTDYNLLWDSARKCIELSVHSGADGWRKAKHWKRELKGFTRQIGRVSAGGGKNKATRLLAAVTACLSKAGDLAMKVKATLDSCKFETIQQLCLLVELEYYHSMLNKQIDLVDRRLLKGEEIPHQEKVFSIFQPYTEWIQKGKLRPNVEIGKKLFVTTDQYNLIVDYQIGDHQADNQLTIQIADRLLNRYRIQSLSVDKGFSSKEDKALLEAFIPQVMMPKRGRRNAEEKALESSPKFIRLKNQHSAIESNINELEHRGLDRCPDRTESNFKSYIGLGVCAYNLHKIGRKLLQDRLEKQKKEELLRKAA